MLMAPISIPLLHYSHGPRSTSSAAARKSPSRCARRRGNLRCGRSTSYRLGHRAPHRRCFAERMEATRRAIAGGRDHAGGSSSSRAARGRLPLLRRGDLPRDGLARSARALVGDRRKKPLRGEARARREAQSATTSRFDSDVSEAEMAAAKEGTIKDGYIVHPELREQGKEPASIDQVRLAAKGKVPGARYHANGLRLWENDDVVPRRKTRSRSGSTACAGSAHSSAGTQKARRCGIRVANTRADCARFRARNRNTPPAARTLRAVAKGRLFAVNGDRARLQHRSADPRTRLDVTGIIFSIRGSCWTERNARESLSAIR